MSNRKRINMKSKTLRQLNKSSSAVNAVKAISVVRRKIGVKYEMEAPTNLSQWFLLRTALPGCASTARCPHREHWELGLPEFRSWGS